MAKISYHNPEWALFFMGQNSDKKNLGGLTSLFPSIYRSRGGSKFDCREGSILGCHFEGILHEEEEKFIIGRPAGYGISSARSTGLESNNVMQWLMRKLSVFFVPEDKTKLERGQTITMIDENLKVIFLRIVFNDKNIHEPEIYPGVLYNIEKKPHVKWIKKFENLMGHIEYHGDKFFKNIEEINFEDAYIKLQGKLEKKNLYEINDSETILEVIIKPSLELYRKY